VRQLLVEHKESSDGRSKVRPCASTWTWRLIGCGSIAPIAPPSEHTHLSWPRSVHHRSGAQQGDGATDRPGISKKPAAPFLCRGLRGAQPFRGNGTKRTRSSSVRISATFGPATSQASHGADVKSGH
jgi:hypothetical protein